MFKKGDKVSPSVLYSDIPMSAVCEVLDVRDDGYLRIENKHGIKCWYPANVFTLHTPKQTDMNIPEGLEVFDLETALANPDRVVCRDGSKVTELHHYKTLSCAFCVYGVIRNSLQSFLTDGTISASEGCENPKDLFLRTVQVKRYYNIGDDAQHMFGWYSTLDKAKNAANRMVKATIECTYRANQLVDVRIVHRFNEQP